MCSTLKSLIVVLLMSLLTGCAGPQVSQDTSPADLKDRGIVIISVTHNYEAGASAKPVFYVNQKLPSNSLERRQLRSRPDVLGIPSRSDFGDVYGQVYVLSVEPGTHQIDGWMTIGGNLQFTPRYPPPPLRFEVKAGDVLYIGNLNMNHDMGRGLFGISRIVGVSPEVRDHRVIDIPVAEGKAPIIKGRVVVNLLPLGVWQADGP
jgi:hypothetical protein